AVLVVSGFLAQRRERRAQPFIFFRGGAERRLVAFRRPQGCLVRPPCFRPAYREAAAEPRVAGTDSCTWVHHTPPRSAAHSSPRRNNPERMPRSLAYAPGSSIRPRW